MSTFLRNFRPDPDDESRLIWRTAKPLLRAAVVAVAPPYPDYPELTSGKTGTPSTDPSCLWAGVVGSEVEVVLYSYSGNGFDGFQKRAWDFLLANTTTIELALRRKLFAWHQKQLAQHCEEDLPHVPELQAYWAQVERLVPLNEPAAVDHLFKLVGISLTDSGLDESGFSSFEFQTGWDRDHGLGVLMHRDRVLAVGGTTELIYGPNVAEGARLVQAYGLDDGDFPL